MNLRVFFTVTGVALIVIAAGVLAYGVHDLQEARILPGLGNLAWNIDGYEVTSWYGAIMKGVFNFGPQMTVLEVFVYFAYLIPTMALFLLPRRSRIELAPAAQSPEPTAIAVAARQGS
jgi:high-affinity iron transporter